MKKFLSVILSLLMIISVVSMAAVPASAVTLVWPVPGYEWCISQGYHDGKAIDISGASIEGKTVVAAMSGTVTHTYRCGNNHANYGDCGGFGTGVVIAGDDGRIYQYAHMYPNSIPANVYVGAYVTAGSPIGAVGNTGWSYGAHLHFGISIGAWYNQSGIDPSKETYGSVNVNPTVWYESLTPITEYGDDFYCTIHQNWANLGQVDGKVQIVAGYSDNRCNVWRFVKQSDNSYVIYNFSNNKVLTVTGNSNIDCATIGVSDYTGADTQKWYIYKSSDNTSTSGLTIRPKSSDKVLDVAGGVTEVGTRVQLYTQNSTAAQGFGIYILSSIVSVDSGYDSSPVRFYWTNNSNASHYKLVLTHKVNGEYKDYITLHNIFGNEYTYFLPAGEYKVLIWAYCGDVYKDGSVKRFSVSVTETQPTEVPTTKPTEATTQPTTAKPITTEPTESTAPTTESKPTATEPIENTEPTTESKPTTEPTESKPVTEPTEAVKPTEKTQVSITYTDDSLYVKQQGQIYAFVDNSVGDTVYVSANPDVAKVDENGVITAVSKGKTIIYAENNGVSESFILTVKKPKLNKTNVTLKPKKSVKLKITGKVGKAIFKSSNTKVATVNSQGKIVAKKKGKATITVTTNGLKLKCKVKVK